MRIRSTKPEFWRSERVASVSWDARLVLKGLESYVDDNGVGKDDLALIVADVFPRDLSRNPPGILQKVSEAISELKNAGLLWRYENDGTNLLYISFWETVQRIEKPTKGRFRRPDGTFDYRESVIGASFPESSRNPPGTLRPGTGEQGNRGTGTNMVTEAKIVTAQPATPVTSDRFDEFWAAYPRKVGKPKARHAWQQARKRADQQAIIAGTARYRDDPNRDDGFTAHPQTWLNRDGWNDPPLPSRSRAAPNRVQDGLAVAAQLRALEAQTQTTRPTRGELA